MLTESQAWALIADAEICEHTDHIHFYIRLEGIDGLRPPILSYGLCYMLDNMEGKDISIATCVAMHRRVQAELKLRDPNDTGYMFPKTEVGQQERLAFARRMSEQTK